MARKFGGDPAATDSTRVLRLPGFMNRKYDANFQVQAEKRTDRIYHLQDFRLRTEPIEDEFRPRRHSQTIASSEPRHLSQSEYDWAYAKRALARGDDPEEIIRRIADYRGVEKHAGYARRTVEKAQQESQRGAGHVQSAETPAGRTDETSIEK